MAAAHRGRGPPGKGLETYALAYIDLGALHAARGYYLWAIRTARRKGHLPARGAALHGLFLLETEAGKLEQAEAHARKALRAYGAGHPRLPDLLHDLARLWLALERPKRAAPMLKKLLPGRAEGRERALSWRSWRGPRRVAVPGRSTRKPGAPRG